MVSLIGKTLKNRYKVIKSLGRGGMAEVYLAADRLLESQVAVKVIQTENILPKVLQRGIKRFQIEARKMAQLTHPNIVPVSDYGEHEGQPYIVMRYLPGGTLKDRLGKAMPFESALRLLLPVADALAYAHGKGLVHRDVKPSNILLTEGDQPMLSDFGIVKILEGEEMLDLTVTGMGVGTPEYMAPEQAEGKGVDARADIYALGVVLYELLTGRKPFEADTPMAVLVKHLHDPLPNPGQYVKHLPNEVVQMLYKALAKQPGERYQSMDEMMAAMQGALKAKPEVIEVQRAHHVESHTEKQREPTIARETSQEFHIPKPPPVKKDGSIYMPLWITIGLIAASVGINKAIGNRPSEPAVVYATETTLASHTVVGTATPEFIPQAKYETVPVIDSQVSPKDSMVLVYVPAGEFLMGSSENDADADDNEKPQRNVYLDAFWMDETEVTNAQYALCVAEGACSPPSSNSSLTHYNYYGNPAYDDFPVIRVNWQQASDYCTWAGRQLPTEAEWEKAARGTDGRRYPWGEAIDCDLANCDRCMSDTTAVGSYPKGASPYGALDMVGNVWEWVADWYDGDYYSESPNSNPLGPSSGSYRVLRGGSWINDERGVRVAYRDWVFPGSRWGAGIGFRCASSP